MQRTPVVFILAFLAVSIPGFSFRAEAQSYKEGILYSFQGSTDGGAPISVALGPDDVLYAVTETGGDLSCFAPNGCGVLLKLNGPGDEEVLHTFTGTPDGAFPASNMIVDSSGNIYSTTSEGGSFTCFGIPYGCGTVFSYSNGAYSEPYSFSGPPDGDDAAGLVLDSAGNLYGVTAYGGAGPCAGDGVTVGCGAIFEIPNGGSETILYSFQGGLNGELPYTLVRDSNGNLYGTAASGGRTCKQETGGCGVIFKLNASGKETTLFEFPGGGNGGEPMDITLGSNGAIYGVTYLGGPLSCNNGTGCGVVFEFTGNAKENVLHAFIGGLDGAQPFAPLIRDKAGNLYGVTYSGGNTSCDCGTVFEVDTAGNETILHAFGPAPDGAYPYGGLAMDSAGNIYGATGQGGKYGAGTIFKLEVEQ
jgi:uncharacterized repeat protein (TIGR03803 family)